jgi:serine/threonine-protein kinase
MSDITTRLNAALAERYDIERQLGEGGMATVYLAKDLKHNRNVALKVLKPELAAVVGADRFLAEIETTANLQHPNVLPLFDSGEADSFLFYVMPYVEGESLRERLDRERQLPVDEALRIATDVAGALDHAHRRGVIHRDIKPANILLQDGRPLIADFGIALALSAAGSGRLTETGLSLGTPYYMSPEQATADRDPGPRSDVYSLGCVLYEMLTGEPPFTGSSAQAILGKIVTSEPTPPSGLRSTVPAHVDRVILKSLAKLPADRFGSAAKLAEALADPTSRLVVGSAHRGTGPAYLKVSERLVWATAVLACLAAVVLVRFGPADEASDREALRLTIQLPDSVPMAFIGAATLGNGRKAFAVSEDARELVYAGMKDGVTRLYLRRLDSYEIRELPGTERAYGPFFSPNGRWVGFFVGNQLRKVRVDGGEPVTIAEAANSTGADWSEDGRIVFADGEGGGIKVVSDQGGSVDNLGARVQEPTQFLWPKWLPGAKQVLNADLIIDVETGAVRNTGGVGSPATYLPPGYLVEMQFGNLHAARFDLASGAVTSVLPPMLGGVRREMAGEGQWEVIEDGTLFYAQGPGSNEGAFTWVDADGTQRPLGLPVRERGTFELSPDGSRLATLEIDPTGSHVWVYDLADGRARQITVEPGAGNPLDWSPDGREVLFHRRQGADREAYARSVDAGIPERELLPDQEQVWSVYAWSRDGSSYGVEVDDPQGLGVFQSPSGDVRRINSDSTAWGLVISPAGDAVAYTSEATGEYHNFLEPFPPTGERIQISLEGGAEEPRWSEDGRRIYYRNGRRILAVGVTLSPTLSVSRPVVLFEGDFANVGGRSYDVAADGRLIIIEDPVVTTTTIYVVRGWRGEAERLIAEAEGSGR